LHRMYSFARYTGTCVEGTLAAQILHHNRDLEDALPSCPPVEKVSYTDYNNPFEMVHDASGSPHIGQLSPFSWVRCGSDVHVLECLGAGFVRIDPTDQTSATKYEAYYTPTRHREHDGVHFERKRKILVADTVESAIRACDTYVRRKVLPGHISAQLRRTASWRLRPASLAQKHLLETRFKRWMIPPAGPQKTSHSSFDTNSLTKGHAANIITRLKHGAQGRYREQARREARVEDKRVRMAARNVPLQIGPLPGVTG